MRVLARLFALALLLAAGSGLYWVDTLRRAAPPAAPTDGTPHEPDYYFVDFTLRRFEQTGTPASVLAGQRLTHYADDDTAVVEAPDFDYLPREAPPWQVTAASGRVGPAGDRVELIDQVVLHQQPDDAQPITIRTSRLTLFNQAGRAETDRPIDAEGPGWQLAATGMTAWLERDFIELHNKVDGRYAPQAQP